MRAWCATLNPWTQTHLFGSGKTIIVGSIATLPTPSSSTVDMTTRVKCPGPVDTIVGIPTQSSLAARPGAGRASGRVVIRLWTIGCFLDAPNIPLLTSTDPTLLSEA